MKQKQQLQSESRRLAEAAEDGASAGAKARRRERSESDSQTAAILGGGGVWTYTYVAEGERRKVRVRESCRQWITAEELLAECRTAARLAADTVQHRHGIPELTPSERADLAAELAARVLRDFQPPAAVSGKGRERKDRWGRMVKPPTPAEYLPPRDKVSGKQGRAYLVQRACGLVLNDPARQAEAARRDDDNLDLLSGADQAAREAGESQSRGSTPGLDPMLNAGVDGSWPIIEAAAERIGAPLRARRTMNYYLAGGTASDWAKVWGVPAKSANGKQIPEGAAWLRQTGTARRRKIDHDNPRNSRRTRLELGGNARRARAAIREAWILDLGGGDVLYMERERIRRGLTDAIPSPRKVREHRPRTEPEEHAPIKNRKRLARRAKPEYLSARVPAPIKLPAKRKPAAEPYRGLRNLDSPIAKASGDRSRIKPEPGAPSGAFRAMPIGRARWGGESPAHRRT